MVAGRRSARRAGASARTALTSRNALLPLRRAVAARAARPHEVQRRRRATRSSCAAAAVAEHRRPRLRCGPSGASCTPCAADGVWVGNLHAQVHDEARAQADLAARPRRCSRWAGGAPAVLGGDRNTRRPAFAGLRAVRRARRRLACFAPRAAACATGPARRLSRRPGRTTRPAS